MWLYAAWRYPGDGTTWNDSCYGSPNINYRDHTYIGEQQAFEALTNFSPVFPYVPLISYYFGRLLRSGHTFAPASQFWRTELKFETIRYDAWEYIAFH